VGFPVSQCAKLPSANPIEPLKGETKRRTEVGGTAPTRPHCLAIRQRDGCMTLETIAPASNNGIARRQTVAS